MPCMNPISFFFIEKVNQQQCSIEVDRSVAKGSIDELDSKLLKAERDITTLKAEHIAGNGLLEKMFSDVASLRTQDEDLQARAHRTSDARIAMHDLTDGLATIIAQLRAHNNAARQYTYAPRPSFASDTSLDEPSCDGVSSSESSPQGLHFMVSIFVAFVEILFIWQSLYSCLLITYKTSTQILQQITRGCRSFGENWKMEREYSSF